MGKTVLDLGSGAGGRAVRFREIGAARVVASEIMPDMLVEREQFSASKGGRLPFRPWGMSSDSRKRLRCSDADYVDSCYGTKNV